MPRSVFRGKHPADSGTKDRKENRSYSPEKSHFSFHHETGRHKESHNMLENLNTFPTEAGAGRYVNDGDCNQESLDATRVTGTDSGSANEDEETSFGEAAVLARNEGRKDQRRGSFSSFERQIYEIQLAQLQEQLVNTMIEYQDTCAELKKLKAIDVHKLQKELQDEKEKNSELKEKLKQKQKSQSSKLQRKNASRIHPRHGHSIPEDMNAGRPGDDWVDLGSEEDVMSHPLSHDTSDNNIATGSSSLTREEYTCEVLDGAHQRHTHANNIRQSEKHTDLSSAKKPHSVQRVRAKLEMWKMQIAELLVDRLWDFVNDEPETSDEEDDEGEPLAVKKLKENISRFSAGVQPITGFIKSVKGIFTWCNPTASFLTFLVYMYSVWHGFLLSLILFIVIWKLFMNYLHAKGIAKQLGFVEDEKNEPNSSEDHSWSDKFQLVLQVSRKVQNTLGNMADTLEKLKNLLMWQHPVASRKLFTFLLMALMASLLLRGETLFRVAGLFLGIKLFIVNPIQHRFPKVKRRYDTTEKLWRELPTDADLAARQNEAEANQEARLRASSAGSLSSLGNGNGNGNLSELSTNCLSDRFKLPASETSLPGWEDGKRCLLMDKDKPFSSFKHVTLFLTQSYLCFEKAKSFSGKHIAIHLETITSISKAKPIGIMPGTGMALEVHVRGVDKPYIFGGIVGRDDVFESIRATGRASNFPWALG